MLTELTTFAQKLQKHLQQPELPSTRAFPIHQATLTSETLQPVWGVGGKHNSSKELFPKKRSLNPRNES